MSKLLDHTSEILVAITVMFFLGGVGYLITLDTQRTVEFKQQCVATGMQYINGSCVK